MWKATVASIFKCATILKVHINGAPLDSGKYKEKKHLMFHIETD